MPATTRALRSKILSVDDIPVNRFVIRELLEPLGFEVVDAASGTEALERATREEYALILLDVMMPGLDGIDTLERLRRIPHSANTPTILVTAAARDTARIERAFSLGAVDYIEKPIAPEILRGKVQSMVALHEAHRALALKDRYIAILAHDLRSPLQTIIGSTHLVQRSEERATAVRATERIMRATERMTTMIRDLLDHARESAAELSLTPEPTDLGVLCRQIVEEFEVAEPERRIELHVTGNVEGEWDARRLYQATSNLLSNATHHGEGQVLLTVVDRGDAVDLSVFNAGTPISPALIPTLFQPFRRGHSDAEGVGLGLHIVDVIAQKHHGRVVVTSTAAGTTFLLQLPKRQPVDAPS